jgi:tetratricopeptide (TPR) repeat protein
MAEYGRVRRKSASGRAMLRRDQSALYSGWMFKPAKQYLVRPFVLAWGLAMLLMAFVFWQHDAISPYVQTMLGDVAQPTISAVRHAQEADQAFWEGDLNKAADGYRRAANLAPTNTDILYELVRVLIYRSYGDVRNLSDIEEARQWAERALEIAPDNARTNAIHCFAMVRIGDSAAAVRSCLRALDLDADNADAHAYLSMASYDLGRTSTALEEAEKAVQLDPQNIDANVAYARTLAFQGRFGAALRFYETAAGINPNLEFPYFEMAFFAYTLANRNNDESRYRIAIGAYEAVLARNEKSVKAVTRLCQTYLAKGEAPLARQYCQQAVQIDPGYTQAWRWLGEVYHSSRNYEDAVDAFTECQRQEIALGIPEANREPTCWWLQGVDYFILGQCDKARPILEDVLRWSTDDIAIRETNKTLLKCATAYEGTYSTPTPVPTATPRPTPIL